MRVYFFVSVYGESESQYKKRFAICEDDWYEWRYRQTSIEINIISGWLLGATVKTRGRT